MEQFPKAYPCAGCKFQRRKCGEKCLLAPYFPSDDPQKFLIAHKVFGTCNILKIIRVVPEEKREDAVTSMVYEATARLNDPVYGCAGVVCKLQKQISQLQSLVSTMQAELVKTHDNLVSLMGDNSVKTGNTSNVGPDELPGNNANAVDIFVLEDVADPFCLWEPMQA